METTTLLVADDHAVVREGYRRLIERHPPLHIVAEHFLPIHFQLMVLPGTSVAQIRTVHSHVHALGQCRKIIRRLGVRPIVAGDTVGAAREVAEAGDPTRGALAPALAADDRLAEHFCLDELLRPLERVSKHMPLASLLEPFIMVIIGVLVGGMVIGMYLPIFKLASVVG